jgi:hypothetical protein
MKTLLGLGGVWIIVFAALAMAAENQPHYDRDYDVAVQVMEQTKDVRLRLLESFGYIKVSTQGSAKQMGLKDDELTAYLRQHFKNHFKDVPFKNPKTESNPTVNLNRPETIGTLFVRVWTVGDDAPVAFYVSLTAGSLADYQAYEDAVLGYTSKDKIHQQVQKSIALLVERLANTFFKLRSGQ